MSDTVEVDVDAGLPVATKTRKKRTSYSVAPETFVEVWNSSTSTNEVAERTGMPKNICQARAAVYRRKGVDLKKMDRANPRRLDVEKLNRL